ncbi:MAG: hypothetical protein K2W95_01750 [Candidatus Obscuribacterales bacterium]|nr:hypothetical protein [Candidatus Obscuribacterales bacterium]
MAKSGFGIVLGAALALGIATLSADSADKSWDDFWRQFKQAIQNNDKEAVANMTKLPYLLDSKQLNRKQFIAKYQVLFPPNVRQGLLKEKPVADKGSYMVFIGEEIFVFSKQKGTYLFSEIGAND